MSSRYTYAEGDGWKLEVDVSCPGYPFLHFTTTKWSHNIYKDFLLRWTLFLSEMKGMKYENVYAAIPKDDSRLLKFHSMFGMLPVYIDEEKIITRRKV